MPQQGDVGEAVVLTGKFFDEDGALKNPGTVTLTLVAPDGTSTEITTGFVHPSTGVYRYTYTPGAEGVWAYTYDGDGDPDVDGTAYFLVGPGPRVGPCEDWTSLDEMRACDRCPTADDGVLLDAITGASELLFMLSGRRYPGICVTTTRPQPGCGCSTRMLDPAPPDGDFTQGCGCGGDREMDLGPSPILGVFEVRVDGAVLPGSAWNVVDRRTLIRTDGGSWPCCQRLADDPATDRGTVSVRFAYGQQPPMLGRAAAAALACEIARDCAGDDCQADERVVSKVRQGVTLQFKLPGDLYDAHGNVRIGVRAADLFLSAFPGGRRAVVRSPDVPRAHRVT